MQLAYVDDNKIMKKIILLIFSPVFFASCIKTFQLEPSLRSRPVTPLIIPGSEVVVKNKNGSLKIRSISEYVRTIDYGDGPKEVMLRKGKGWGRCPYDNMINPIQAGYGSDGMGFIGRGGITRIVYSERTMIFENKQQQNSYMNYRFNKLFDLKYQPGGVAIGFYFNSEREQISIKIYKMEIKS